MSKTIRLPFLVWETEINPLDFKSLRRRILETVLISSNETPHFSLIGDELYLRSTPNTSVQILSVSLGWHFCKSLMAVKDYLLYLCVLLPHSAHNNHRSLCAPYL